MRLLLRCFVLLLAAASTQAATPFESYLDDGTFLVASLDLDDATSTESAQWLIATIEAAAPALGSGDATMPAMITRQAISQLRELRDFGAKDIGLVIAIEDLTMNHGPLLVTKLPDEAAAAKARDWVQPRLRTMPGIKATLSGSMLLVATEATLYRYEKLTPAPRPDLVDPAIEDGVTFAAMLSPGADARRVLRELWPMLPAPYDKLTGPLIADDVRCVTANVILGATPNAQLSINSSNPSAREAIVKSILAGLDTGVAWVETNQPAYVAGAIAAADLLAPEVDGDSVSMRLNITDDDANQLATKVLTPAIHAAQESAKRASKLNDMKQIGLAVLNFESANGFLPGNIVDKEGKPLFSWRVAILPYLEMDTASHNFHLINFHLDEPWDSPHNLEFAKRAIPGVYSSGQREGMTTYLRPLYPGSDLAATRGDTQLIERRFGGRQCFLQPGDKLRDITDGLSNTIMIAEVAPEHAVLWTKPDDWEVDLEDPLAKLRTDKREGFVTGYFDGSARFEPFDIDPGLLKKLVTKSGGEPIER